MTLAVTMAGCLVVGLLIGWSGVAGVLLPILFVNYCRLDTTQALALSFLCFALSGIISSVNYRRKGQLDFRTALPLSAGSLIGAAAGAALNRLLPTDTVKLLLYLVVLFSGASILARQWLARRKSGKAAQPEKVPGSPALGGLGLAAGALCALSGAGGPVVVMPLLVALGLPAKQAVGAALFDSIFIALPALCVYGGQGGFAGLGLFALLCAAAHGVGVTAGSATSQLVPQEGLKWGVAVFSVCFALYMLTF